MIPLPCIIVAGGKSSRMGSDKALLPFGGFNTLTQYQLHRLTPFFQSVHVSTKSKDKFHFDASFIEDISSYQQSSPLIALLSIMQHFKTPVCVISVDTPFVNKEVFEQLFQSLNDKVQAVIATSPSGSHPLCAIYSPTISDKITHMLEKNEHKIKNLLDSTHTIFIPFESDAPFTNLNYPHEYEEARSLQ